MFTDAKSAPYLCVDATGVLVQPDPRESGPDRMPPEARPPRISRLWSPSTDPHDPMQIVPLAVPHDGLDQARDLGRVDVPPAYTPARHCSRV